jgi:hypothetical protein
MSGCPADNPAYRRIVAQALGIGLSVYQPKRDAEPLTKRTGASRHGVIAGRLN